MHDRQPLVLVLNDDGALSNALRFMLQLEAIEVHLHETGAELLVNPHLPRASCLILRDRMRNTDSFGLLERLRSRQLLKPAILLTDAATRDLRARAAAAGVCLVLEKPIMDTALIDAVLNIIRESQDYV